MAEGPIQFPPMRTEERWISGLCHLSTLVPLWALIANGMLYFYYREVSRTICFHARQGISFQLLFLLCVIPFFFVLLLSNLLGLALSPFLSPEAVDWVTLFVRYATYAPLAILSALYGLTCLVGIVQAIRGKVFPYPLVGKRLFENYVRVIYGVDVPEGEAQ